ncbi:MAG: alpha/beta fold hydrolase [Candidatus Thorarchaeota archaeon]
MEENFIKVSEKPFIQLKCCHFPSLNSECRKRNIIVHLGLLDTIENRISLIESFRQISNVIIYEPRGFNKSCSPKKRGCYGITQFSEDLAHIIEKNRLKDRKFFIFGMSLGSAIALNYTVKNKGPKPQALLLNSPESKIQSRWYFKYVQLLPKFFYGFLTKIILSYYSFSIKRKNPENLETIQYSIKRFKEIGFFVPVRIYLECLCQYDITGLESKINTPILAFIAENDWFSNPENSKKIAQYHPKSEVIELGKTHRIHVGREEIITKHIKEFINKLE